MPAHATGSPRWSARQKCWIARVSMPDGTRQPFPMPNIPKDDKAAAIAMAKLVAQRVRELGAVAATAGETTNEWFDRWVESRVAKGLRSTANDRGRYKKWVAPIIGTKPIASVPKRDIELIVQRLDEAVIEAKRVAERDGTRLKFREKTARNVFGVVTKMFADACKSKNLSLRVRDDNPTRDVAPPDRGIERSGPYLFPSEFLAIMRCARVAARWKRLIALAIYTYTRRGELGALACSDVNLDRMYIHVHRALDRKGNEKPTKTGDTRKLSVEPTLVPLLERMLEHAGREGRLVTAMPPAEYMADRLRKYVRWALEDARMHPREELFADDATRRPLSWHDLRHTGVTWRAVRGDPSKKIQRAAGHSDSRTTDIYINEAETFESAETFGTPFPPFDLSALTGEANWAGSGQPATSAGTRSQENRDSGASLRGRI